jgi:hypothetical protein
MQRIENGSCAEREQLTYSLATNEIGQPTEKKLTAESTDGSGDLDTEILVGAQFTTCRQ